ncbi:hypothetical protein E6O75_ATG07680 [Venturia nashicola]|uniref:Uncharacterized protein n=1 Tax=Venturia nashicola TaxID=86259 RepID=A0A4Z1P6T9_9PEZI|nr:hypothetical protein E6O75_ATG07680 [Venturia nashicola]
MDTPSVQPAPFPARTKTTICTIASHPTTITSHSFADKIMITISQDGRLGHWIHVPLIPTPSSSTNGPEPTLSNDLDSDLPPSTLLPDSHHTATTILGGTGTPTLDTLGQLLATQLASLLCSRNPEEGRIPGSTRRAATRISAIIPILRANRHHCNRHSKPKPKKEPRANPSSSRQHDRDSQSPKKRKCDLILQNLKYSTSV